jgi:hypothetical protein
MRTCGKQHCTRPAEATIALRYGERLVVLGNLLADHNPNLLELCMRHADRLSPPVGWDVRDDRTLRWATTAF